MTKFYMNPVMGSVLEDIGTLPDQPAQPVPPGPYDRALPALDALVNYTTPITLTKPVLIVRIAARNNANSNPGLTATYNGVPMALAASVVTTAANTLVEYIFILTGAAAGTHDLVIACSTGSAGLALVRIGEVASVDASPIGPSDSDTIDNYYYELALSRVPGADFTAIIASLSPEAGPIRSEGQMQWQGEVENGAFYLTACFSHWPYPEPGYDYFIAYPYQTAPGTFLGVMFKGLVP